MGRQKTNQQIRSAIVAAIQTFYRLEGNREQWLERALEAVEPLVGVDARRLDDALSPGWSQRTVNALGGRHAELERVAHHFHVGWRLVRRLSDNDTRASAYGQRAAFPNGQDDSEDLRRALRQAVCVAETTVAAETMVATHSSGNPSSAATCIGESLMRGHSSLVDRFEAAGRRYVVIHRNEPHPDEPRQLTARERRCAQLAALGYANAEIAWSVQIAESTASSHVHSAMHKLGLCHRQELVDVLHPSAHADARLLHLGNVDEELWAISIRSVMTHVEPRLSPAERQVVFGLLEGRSTREIAEMRGTSDRTVANQIQSIFRKLGVRSRTELAAALQPPLAAPALPASRLSPLSCEDVASCIGRAG